MKTTSIWKLPINILIKLAVLKMLGMKMYRYEVVNDEGRWIKGYIAADKCGDGALKMRFNDTEITESFIREI